MTSRPHMQPAKRPVPRLYLVTPRIEPGVDFVAPLAAALAAGDVSAVLLRLGHPDERAKINAIKALAPLVQGREVALLIDGDPALVARGGADGAHLSGIGALEAALPTLKPDWIAGAGALWSRHDAMAAGEAGADYVMFGEPDGSGDRQGFDVIEERVAWWAQVFEVPCVAFAGSLDEVGRLAAAGADFVALGAWVWDEPQTAAATVAEANQRLHLAEALG